MSGSFYKLGVELALCASGFQKFSSVLGSLARSAAKSIGMSETRDLLGVETPEWKRVSPLDAAVEAAKDVVEKITGTEEPEVVPTEAPPEVPPAAAAEVLPEPKLE